MGFGVRGLTPPKMKGFYFSHYYLFWVVQSTIVRPQLQILVGGLLSKLNTAIPYLLQLADLHLFAVSLLHIFFVIIDSYIMDNYTG